MKKRYLLLSLFAVFIISAIFYFGKDRTVSKETAIEKCSLPNSKFLEWNGRSVHYVEYGEKQNPQVLTIHGFGGSVHNFKALNNLLAEDYYVLAVDLPGFGLSDVPDMSLFNQNDYMGLYREFIKFTMKEFELNNFHLIGNSMGGWISWETAYAYPDKIKSLTLSASAGYEMEEVAKVATGWLSSTKIRKIVTKGFPMPILKANVHNKIFYDKNKLPKDEIKVNYYLFNKKGTINWMMDLASSVMPADTFKIKEIEIPSMIFWGKHDKIVPVEHADKFHRDLQNSKLKIYEECGHVPQIELASKFKKDLVGFYNSIEDTKVNKIDTLIEDAF